jgi:hypothetical protein
MNYIRHLTAFYEKLAMDDRFSPAHVSLYLALFQCWNMNLFKNPVSVNRFQVMQISKIGSNHTYYKALKDLCNWGYIDYEPSFSPVKGSLINLCIFAQVPKENDQIFDPNLCNIDTATCAKMHPDQCKIDIATCAKMHPSINNININNKTLYEEKPKIQNQDSKTSNKKSKKVEVKTQDSTKKQETNFTRPGIDEVISFFKSENFSELDAKKFFNHFESNGWKVGGKTPMKNWNAAARNWMLNSQRFSTSQNFSTPQQKQKTNPNNKNYSEPL